MAWEGSTRRERLPHDWQARRMRVLRRDGYRCQWRIASGLCLAPANQVDHVVPGDDHDEDNLQSLCREHHAKKSSAEGVAARRPRKRPPERHPAFL